MPNDAITVLKPAHSTVSHRIRERLLARRTRFFANDNIAACIEPGELDELVEEVGARLQQDGLAVLMQADHFCMQWRGVRTARPG